ncbi:RB1-inducible coiled-coil protein 1 [Bacillus rossius redtenbacheri]|uniref:RB1-inducible coiled-coil protein 1 n=1 Tax=Bacillus rossius redtenbacheri TaxID=93214 RepID=UPI002FDE6282
MLYVFHVDTGRMRTFDMNLALESVKQLKEAIEHDCGIPANKQVLLVSGGQTLEPSARVCNYSAGTDTNPIFLFSKCTIESKMPPSFAIDLGSDAELKEQVEGTRDLPDTYMTVGKRVQLAQRFCDLAREQTRVCEQLVHDQHLQQQGWAAVLANLEDTAREFRNRVEIFKQNYLQYLETHQLYSELLKNFHEDLAILSKIPVLPELLEGGSPEPGGCDSSEASCGGPSADPGVCSGDSGVEERAAGGGGGVVTLLEWITNKDNQSSLHQFAKQCQLGLEAFNEEVLEARMRELETVLGEAGRTEMKEVKGLEDRLYGLDQLMCEAKKFLQEQGDMAQSFSQNQTRANNLGDPSILPDLCKSHRHYVQMMHANHRHLLDIRGRCARAKEELCLNLHLRLKWVAYVESSLFEAGGRLVMYHDGLRRLRHSLEAARQVHRAPQAYAAAVGEVVRRRAFSRAFLLWANDLSSQLLAVHNEEVARRTEFKTRFEGHFLNSLFPGMEDLPPPFATQAPAPFDSRLPKLTMEDFENLKQELPKLSFSLTQSDIESITQFFLLRSFTGTLKLEEKEQVKELEDQLVKVVAEAGLAEAGSEGLLQPTEADKQLPGQSPSPVLVQGVTHLRDQDRGFESETDTEEFEKVGQSPVELRFDAKQVAAVTGGAGATIATLEENLGSTRAEADRLRGLLLAAGRTASRALCGLRDELSLMRTRAALDRGELVRLCADLGAALGREREAEAQLALAARERELEALRADSERRLAEEEAGRQALGSELRRRLDAAEAEKARALKEQADALLHDYKAELESLRSRFRMATASMERSPSDTSLEKIERPDISAEREAAIKLAVEQERSAWEARLENEIKAIKMKVDAEKQVWFNEAIGRVVEEKDRQLDALLARESSLVEECRRHREEIQRLNRAHSCRSLDSVRSVTASDRAQPEGEAGGEVAGSGPSSLPCTLDGSGERKTGSPADMNSSVAVVPEGNASRDVATSPEPAQRSLLSEQAMKEKLTRSQTSLVQQGKISIASCNPGDAVLVMWDDEHCNYTIVQDTSTLYFLHSDYVEGLGLKPTPDGFGRRYSSGEVIDKEYCHAKKPENRYRVPKGTKFYRVRVRPLSRDPSLARSHHHHHHHHHHQGYHHESPLSASTSSLRPGPPLQQAEQ